MHECVFADGKMAVWQHRTREPARGPGVGNGGPREANMATDWAKGDGGEGRRMGRLRILPKNEEGAETAVGVKESGKESGAGKNGKFRSEPHDWPLRRMCACVLYVCGDWIFFD